MNISQADNAIMSAVSAKMRSSALVAPSRTVQVEKLDWSLPGFHPRARVLTSFGQLPVEALRLRDLVKTQSGRFLPVQWIDKVTLDADFLERHPQAQPISIPQNAFGQSVPAAAFMVSPGQVVKMPASIMNGDMKLAKDLVGRTHIRRASQASVTYFMFHCGADTSVSVEGVWCKCAPRG
ncbi:MAG: Hint domain-containing protein [Sulfitobacter sp.]